MMLREDPCFGRRSFVPEPGVVNALAERCLFSIPSESTLFYLGYVELKEALCRKYRILTPSLPVDNFFCLGVDAGFEAQKALLTVGLRSSRFAPILFWEAFHILQPDGVWLDIDLESYCDGTPLCEHDFLDRDYFRSSLSDISMMRLGSCRARLMRKKAPSIIAPSVGGSGWTFGILTAGPSAAAERMIREILTHGPADSEIIICGPMPENTHRDSRVRQIDLDVPEPRGWITRKKNLIVDAALHENLCIMHDRFLFPEGFWEAMHRYGDLFSVLTFPQLYFADVSRSCVQRYPDYQVLLMGEGIQDTFRTKLFNGNQIFHPRYDDFMETAFCCGGVYVIKKCIWNLIRQDESLYHCEWEDVLFGLEAQSKGIPHRVNPYACFESLVPHPLLLTRINISDPSGRNERSFLHISNLQKRKAVAESSDFLPIMRSTFDTYCAKIINRFNALPMVDVMTRLEVDDFVGMTKLSEIWETVCRRMNMLPINNRDEVFQLFALLSDVVYNHPVCILQNWMWEAENKLCRIEKNPDVIAAVRRSMAEGGIRHLLTKVQEWVRRRLRCIRLNGTQYEVLAPFYDLVSYFREVEQYYPVFFAEDQPNSRAENMGKQSQLNLQGLLAEESCWRTIFIRREKEVLPPLTDEGVYSSL